MSEYPCDWHLQRYPGAATRVFLNVYRDDQEAKFKASVCPDCLAEVVTEWISHALHRGPDGAWNPPDGLDTLDGLWKAQETALRPVFRR